MNAKVCKQCGELKPIEQFRKYYGGRKGHYNTCKMCEKINARYKYLRSKGDTIDYQEESEIHKIEELYDAQRKAGLRPPNVGERKVPLVDSLDDMIAKYNTTPTVPSDKQLDGPHDLTVWLTCELTEEPDYYLDEVYEALKAKYRPAQSINTETMQPVYDDTYKDTLDRILERFYAYEEKYWNEDK